MKPLTKLHGPTAMKLECLALLLTSGFKVVVSATIWIDNCLKATWCFAYRLLTALSFYYSISLLSCFLKLTSVACQYRCDPENIAREKYITVHSKMHESFPS